MELGGLYAVPHIRAPWPGSQPNWIPVLGPRHNDTEIIGFDPEHFHLDFRFVEEDLFQQAEAAAPVNAIYAISWVYRNVISTLAPDTEPQQRARLNPRGQLVDLETGEACPAPVESWYQHRTAEYRREYPENPTYLLPWIKKLEQAYAKARLKPDMKCPHRGADLHGLEVKNNQVICPLHGLRWNVRSGRMEPSP